MLNKTAAFTLALAATAALPSPALAQRGGECIPEAEFDAAAAPLVERGDHSISLPQFSGRNLCTGKSIGDRLSELSDLYHPERQARREASLAERAAVDRAEWEEEQRRLALQQQREEELAAADHEAALADAAAATAEAQAAQAQAEAAQAEAEWRAAVARSRAAQAELSRAEAERQLASLPPVDRESGIILYPVTPLSGRDREAVEDDIERILIEDSRAWGPNSYQPDSVEYLEVLTQDADFENYEVLARFRYARGGGPDGEGWVKVEYRGRRFHCLTFHNDDKACRQIGDSLSRRVAADVVISIAASVMGNFVSKFFRI